MTIPVLLYACSQTIVHALHHIIQTPTDHHYLQNDLCISYNMGKRDLPDIYALARGPQARGRGHIYQANPDCGPRAWAYISGKSRLRPEGVGIYIRQIPIAHVISDIYHLSIYHVRQIKKNFKPTIKTIFTC